MSMYRCEHFSDIDKKYMYQKIADEMMERRIKPDDDCIFIKNSSLREVATEYESKGDYETAIKYYI